MKKSLLLFCFVIFAFGLQAQITITPETVVVTDVSADDFEGIAHSKAKNLAAQLKTYKWTRTVVEITESWQSAVCDKNQCYLPHVESMEFQLGPLEEGLLDVHVYPNGVVGSAVIEVTVEDTNNADQNATGVYYFNQTPSSSTGIEVHRDRFRVYPNPSQGVFSITGGDRVERIQVYNLAGKLVSSFQSVIDNQYDIRSLPRGSYLIQLIGQNGGIVTTKLIQKI